MLQTFACQDSRIEVVDLSKNQGVAHALNVGLSFVRGDFVARCDADDIYDAERIRTQVSYFERDESLDILGCSLSKISPGKSVEIIASSDPCLTKWSMLFFCSLAHPTVMWRHDAFRRFQVQYSTRHRACEDYELWLRLLFGSPKYDFRVANTMESLVQIRRSPTSISAVCAEQQQTTALELATEAISSLIEHRVDTCLVEAIRRIQPEARQNDGLALYQLLVEMEDHFIRKYCQCSCPAKCQVTEDCNKRLGEVAMASLKGSDPSASTILGLWMQRDATNSSILHQILSNHS